MVLWGESGSGKEVLSRAVHAHSSRRDAEFVVFDVGSTSPSLIEAELFGYEKGAFTGAVEARTGLLPRAH